MFGPAFTASPGQVQLLCYPVPFSCPVTLPPPRNLLAIYSDCQHTHMYEDECEFKEKTICDYSGISKPGATSPFAAVLGAAMTGLLAATAMLF